MSTDRVYVRGMPSALMTAEQLLQTTIPDKRVELVRGVLVVREPAGYRHGRVSMNLAFLLSKHVEGTEAGQVVSGDTGFKLASDPDTVRAPDVAFIGRERLPDKPVASPRSARTSSSKFSRPTTDPAKRSPRSAIGSKGARVSSGSSTLSGAWLVCTEGMGPRPTWPRPARSTARMCSRDSPAGSAQFCSTLKLTDARAG